MKRSFCLVAAALSAGVAVACSTYVVGKGVSRTGCVIVGHNEDMPGWPWMRHGVVPARDWPEGVTLPAEKGRAKVPQVAHTLAFFWSEAKGPDGGLVACDSFYNEKGVLVVSNGGGGCREEASDDACLTDGGIEYNVRRIVAERATSARDAMSIVTNLVTVYGYYPKWGRMYTVADRDEAWVVQLSRGRHWVARRCPDDEIAVIANCYSVHDLRPGDLYPADIREYARDRGWWNGSEPFDFARAYQTPKRWKANRDVKRLRESLGCVVGGEWTSDDYPFSVRPSRPFDAAEMERLLATTYDFYQNTVESSVCVFGETPDATRFRVSNRKADGFREIAPFDPGEFADADAAGRLDRHFTSDTFPLEWNPTFRTDVPYEVEISAEKLTRLAAVPPGTGYEVRADGHPVDATFLRGKAPGTVLVRFRVPAGTRSLTCSAGVGKLRLADSATVENVFAGALGDAKRWTDVPKKGTRFVKTRIADGIRLVNDGASGFVRCEADVPDALRGQPVKFELDVKNVAKTVWSGYINLRQYDAEGKEISELVSDPRWTSHMRPVGKLTAYRENGRIHPAARKVALEIELRHAEAAFDPYGEPVRDASVFVPALEVTHLALRPADVLPFPKYADEFFPAGVTDDPADRAIRLGGEKAFWYATRSKAAWTDGKQVRDGAEAFFPIEAGTMEAYFKADRLDDRFEYPIFEASGNYISSVYTLPAGPKNLPPELRGVFVEVHYLPAKERVEVVMKDAATEIFRGGGGRGRGLRGDRQPRERASRPSASRQCRGDRSAQLRRHRGFAQGVRRRLRPREGEPALPVLPRRVGLLHDPQRDLPGGQRRPAGRGGESDADPERILRLRVRSAQQRRGDDLRVRRRTPGEPVRGLRALLPAGVLRRQEPRLRPLGQDVLPVAG